MTGFDESIIAPASKPGKRVCTLMLGAIDLTKVKPYTMDLRLCSTTVPTALTWMVSNTLSDVYDKLSE